MNKYTFIILLFLTTIGIISCSKSPNYPKEPFIRFEKVEKFTFLDEYDTGVWTDSIVVHTYFEDGDGDLGEKAPSEYGPNFLGDLYYKNENGNFQLLDFTGPTYRVFFDPLVDKNYRGPIDGILRKSFKITHNDINRMFNTVDKAYTVRMEIQIRDRANNLSNTITTSEFSIGKR